MQIRVADVVVFAAAVLLMTVGFIVHLYLFKPCQERRESRCDTKFRDPPRDLSGTLGNKNATLRSGGCLNRREFVLKNKECIEVRARIHVKTEHSRADRGAKRSGRIPKFSVKIFATYEIHFIFGLSSEVI